VVTGGADSLWFDEESCRVDDKDRVFGFELLFEREGGVVVGGEREGLGEAGRGLSDLGTRMHWDTQTHSHSHSNTSIKRDSRGSERRFHERRIRHCGPV
jgi:hypothetical protein